MKTKFEKFIEKNYKGLNMISIPNEAYKPGIILSDEDRIFSHLQKLFSESSDGDLWKTKLLAANLPNQVVSGEKSLDLGVAILGILTLKGGFNASYTVSFEFDEVSVAIFDHDSGGAYESDVRLKLRGLKDSDPVMWNLILHKYIVMEVVIINSARITLKRDGKALGEVDLPILENEVSIDGTYNWSADGVMEIHNVKKLPFGVLGFQVKRGI